MAIMFGAMPDSEDHRSLAAPDDVDHDSDVSSDTSSILTELDQDDFLDSFEQRDGRLFHSHGRSPYPLPVDGDEQRRQNGQHEVLRSYLGANYVGPVQDVLVSMPDMRRRVVDVGCGTGKWILQMAFEFPHVRFDGLDIVPIATRHPPANVLFEMHDVNEGFRYENSSIDMVHTRVMSMVIKNYPSFLQEVIRVLRPGGLFLSGEFIRFPCMYDGSDVRASAPGACNFFDVVTNVLLGCGIPSVAGYVHAWLAQTNQFVDITSKQYFVPIGGWHDDPVRRDIGIRMKDLMKVYAQSMKFVLVHSGRAVAEVERLIQGYLEDLDSVQGLICVYCTVHARKV